MSRKEDNETERVDFRVYNMPSKLTQKYISMAKLHYDNEVWRVLAEGMRLLLQKQTPHEKLEERVAELEAKVSQLQTTKKFDKFDNIGDQSKKKTFGDQEEDTNIDKLKQMRGEKKDE